MKLRDPRSLNPIKDASAEQRLFFVRVIAATAVVLAAFLLVAGRLVQLQVLQHDYFADLSQGNRIRIEPLPPTRGLIFDRNGAVLAENLPAYQLVMIPEQVPDVEATLLRLTGAGLIEREELPRLRELIAASPRFKSIPLRFRLDERESARFAIMRPRFPGVDIEARLIRHYPYGSTAVHAVGYVGGLSAADLERIDPAVYAGTNQIGKTGAERAYESALHGRVGHEQSVTNARGRAIGAIPGEAPAPGDNVYLTLDIELQLVAEGALGERRGAVVALDPASGEVLALASTPGFDPNGFAVGLRVEEYRALEQDRDRPLFNRAIRGQYPPGSTIKPMLAVATLDTDTVDPGHSIFCRGHYSLPGSTHRYRDWKPEGHGTVNLHDAIAQSCDVYFYQLASQLGIDRMHDYLTRFGLGTRLGIDIGGEKRGLAPSREWKRSAFSRRADQVWFPGETVIVSIGQGYLLATPLQLAHATAAVAMRGQRFRPHLGRAVENPLTGERRMAQAETLPPVELADILDWEVVISAMQSVLQSETGTARAVGLGAAYPMAGKSGTAQVFSVAQEEEYDEAEIDERLRDHALFVAFAPLDTPLIAVAVIVENGSSGSRTAAPIAKAVMDRWLGADRETLASAEAERNGSGAAGSGSSGIASASGDYSASAGGDSPGSGTPGSGGVRGSAGTAGGVAGSATR